MARFCRACGSEITEKLYQMRAADEASTSTWSCDNCPVDESRIRLSEPVKCGHMSYPRVTGRGQMLRPTYVSSAPPRSYSCIELELVELPPALAGCNALGNVRYACAVLDETTERRLPAHGYAAGAYAGSVATVTEAAALSPKCRVYKVDVYSDSIPDSCTRAEKDGVVRTITIAGGHTVHVYSKDIAAKTLHSAVLRIDQQGKRGMYTAMVALHSMQQSWPDIRGFLSKDQLSAVNNLSPRAWDSKRLQKKGAIYSPKVDGERAYVLVYQGVAHMF